MSEISGSGTINPSGSVDYPEGEDILFTISPETGWKITSFMINGNDHTDQLVDEGSEFTYTVAGFSQDIDVTVEFSIASGLENNQKEEIKVFPVPAEDVLYLKDVKVKTLRIFGANGKIVKELKENIGNSINTSDLKKGMYILILEDENDESHSARFIKR